MRPFNRSNELCRRTYNAVTPCLEATSYASCRGASGVQSERERACSTMTRRATDFQTLPSEGGLLPPYLLRRVLGPKAKLDLTPMPGNGGAR